jgi:hypothetical protein
MNQSNEIDQIKLMRSRSLARLLFFNNKFCCFERITSKMNNQTVHARRGRPKLNITSFVAEAAVHFKLRPDLTQEQLADIFNRDVSNIKRRVRRANFKSYGDFKNSLLSE